MSQIPNPFSVLSEQLKQTERQLIKLNRELLKLKKRYNGYRHEEQELEADLAHVRNKSRDTKKELLQLQNLIHKGQQQLNQLRGSLLEYSLLRQGWEKGEHGIQHLSHYTAKGIRFLVQDLRNLLGKQATQTTPQLPRRPLQSGITPSKSEL